MATRLYLSNTAAAINLGGPLSGGGIWEASRSGIASTRKLTATATSSWAVGAVGATVGTGTNPNDIMWWQGISEPLAAQSITGNFSGTCCCRENTSLSTNAFTQCGVFVIDGSGTRVATLIAGQTSGGTEFNNPSANNRTFPRNGAAAVSSYTCSAGDRICVELGIRVLSTRTADTVNLYLGDNGASDLPFGDGTSNNLTINPWVEFANSLTFATLSAKRTSAQIMGFA